MLGRQLQCPHAEVLAQDGTLLVQVKGHFQMGGSGPLAMGPQGAGPPTAFLEDFTLSLSSAGTARILKQSYRTV